LGALGERSPAQERKLGGRGAAESATLRVVKEEKNVHTAKGKKRALTTTKGGKYLYQDFSTLQDDTDRKKERPGARNGAREKETGLILKKTHENGVGEEGRGGLAVQ